jgi:hypothetical protein
VWSSRTPGAAFSLPDRLDSTGMSTTVHPVDSVDLDLPQFREGMHYEE